MPVAVPERVLSNDPHLALDHLFPTSLTITRTSEDDTVMCELEPGRHVLRVHNTLVWRTEEVVLAPGEQIFYEAINRAAASTYFLLPLFGIGPLYVTLRRMA